jgi:Protein of unknown function (DUF2934)
VAKSRKESAPTAPSNLTDQIRARAYQLFEDRGKQDGYDIEDWLSAEAELRESNTRKAAA